MTDDPEMQEIMSKLFAPPPTSGCTCAECWSNYPYFRVCRLCGNKRCPKAKNHGFSCTNSNETGQEGVLLEPGQADPMAKAGLNPGFAGAAMGVIDTKVDLPRGYVDRQWKQPYPAEWVPFPDPKDALIEALQAKMAELESRIRDMQPQWGKPTITVVRYPFEEAHIDEAGYVDLSKPREP